MHIFDELGTGDSTRTAAKTEIARNGKRVSSGAGHVRRSTVIKVHVYVTEHVSDGYVMPVAIYGPTLQILRCTQATRSRGFYIRRRSAIIP